MKKKWINLTIYMNNDLSLNLSRPFKLTYSLNVEQQQFIFDLFYKYLPYNYEWSGNDVNAMFINHKKNTKKIKKIKIKKISDYPKIYIWCDLNIENGIQLSDKNNFITESNEFKEFNKIVKNCKYDDYEYSTDYFSITLYGVKNIKTVQTFFKKLKKKGKLTFGSDKIPFKEIQFWGYNTKNDYTSNIYFDENGKTFYPRKKRKKKNK